MTLCRPAKFPRSIASDTLARHALPPRSAIQLAARVDWRFTTQDARIRLKRLYPSFQE